MNPENTQLIKLDYTKENRIEIVSGDRGLRSMSVNGVRGGGLGHGSHTLHRLVNDFRNR